MQKNKIDQAVQFSIDHETSWSREITANWGIHHEDPPPWNRLLGSVHERGSSNMNKVSMALQRWPSLVAALEA